MDLSLISLYTPLMHLSKQIIIFPFPYRAEGSSKIQSRLEQQTSRLSQQMKTGTGNKAPSSTKSSPPKEKMSPSSPMDDIERGIMS